MKMRALALLAIAGSLATGNSCTDNHHASVNSVTFDRILHASREPYNWFTYSGGYSSQRHSGLTQITPENVKGLIPKWTSQSGFSGKYEATPLVVDGVMYTVEGINDVVALDAATGKEIWSYSHKPDPNARNCCGQMTRGLAILDHRLFLAALDSRMIALDTRTGKELWNILVANPAEKYSFTHAPLVVKDKVIEGTGRRIRNPWLHRGVRRQHGKRSLALLHSSGTRRARP
jgi:glucose dehydrogenase